MKLPWKTYNHKKSFTKHKEFFHVIVPCQILLYDTQSEKTVGPYCMKAHFSICIQITESEMGARDYVVYSQKAD